MVAPLVFVVVSNAGRAIVQYATRKAAQNAAKRIGGKVVEKSASKTVSKLPKGGSAKANQALEANTLRASRSVPKGKGKGPDIKPTQADRIGGGGAKPKPKANTKPDARGSATQKGLLLTAATTGVGAVGTGENKKSSTPARTPMSSSGIKPKKKVDNGRKQYRPGRGDGKINSRGHAADTNRKSDWRDFKSVRAAQKGGSNYFMGSDGKKKIAITAEQLKKKYPKMSSSEALRKYANSLKG